jgi:hypothetical protein
MQMSQLLVYCSYRLHKVFRLGEDGSLLTTERHGPRLS